MTFSILYLGASQVVPEVKKPPANAGDVRDVSLGWEDLLEEEMATHSSILAWRIPWTEEPGRLESMGSQRVGHDWSNLAACILRNGRSDCDLTHTHTQIVQNFYFVREDRFSSPFLGSPHCCLLLVPLPWVSPDGVFFASFLYLGYTHKQVHITEIHDWTKIQ